MGHFLLYIASTSTLFSPVASGLLVFDRLYFTELDVLFFYFLRINPKDFYFHKKTSFYDTQCHSVEKHIISFTFFFQSKVGLIMLSVWGACLY